MKNSQLHLPFGTQDNTVHSTTEDVESLTTGEQDKTEIVV